MKREKFFYKIYKLSSTFIYIQSNKKVNIMKYNSWNKLYGGVAKLQYDKKRLEDLGWTIEDWQIEDLTEKVLYLQHRELTRDYFVDLMESLIEVESYFRELEKQLEDIFSDSSVIFNSHSDDIVDGCQDELDYKDDTIAYYYYDCDHETAEIEYNGVTEKITSFEELYDYILKHKNDGKPVENPLDNFKKQLENL